MIVKGMCKKLLIPIIASAAITPFAYSCSIEIWPDFEPITVTFSVDETEGEHIVEGSPETILDDETAFGLINSPRVKKDSEEYPFVLDWWSYEKGGDPIRPDEKIKEDVTVYPIWREQTDEDNSIMAIIGSDKYVCDETLWTDEEDIHLTPYEGAPIVEDIPRNEFNYPIEIGCKVRFLPDDFLVNCSSFDSTVTFKDESELIYIGMSFMSMCVNFNQPLVLPNTLICVYDNFMGDCQDFNQPLVLPDTLQIIGQDFLSNCYAFNQDITFGINIGFLGQHCMYNCTNFTSLLTIGVPMANIDVGSGSGWASTQPNQPIAETGFTVNVLDPSEKQLFLDSFPTIERTDPSHGFYRTIKPL